MARPAEIHPTVALALEGYRKAFAERPSYWVKVPLGMTLMGSRAAEIDGIALGVCFDPSIALAIAPRMDGMLEWLSWPDGARVSCRVDRCDGDLGPAWARVAAAAIRELRKRGNRVSGFNAVLTRSGGGVADPARSASLMVLAITLAVRELFPFSASDEPKSPPERSAGGLLRVLSLAERLWLGRFAQRVEEGMMASGAPTGLSASVALLARPGSLVELDCQTDATEFYTLPQYGWFLSESQGMEGSDAIIAPAFPNALRQLSRRIGVSSLRTVEESRLNDPSIALTHEDRTQALHVIQELRRIVALGRALAGGDVSPLGPMLEQNELSRSGAHGVDARLAPLIALSRREPSSLATLQIEECPPRRLLHLVDPSCLTFATKLSQHSRESLGVEVCLQKLQPTGEMAVGSWIT